MEKQIKIALAGNPNCGKTTLFRLLTGELSPDSGEIHIAAGKKLGLISQIPVYPEGYTVEDVLQSAFERMRRMADEMERLSAQMANGDESEETLRRYGELSARFEGLGGYDTATAKNKVANGLSIDGDMRQKLFDQLSGGEQQRVAIARALINNPSTIIADEPTGNLDPARSLEIMRLLERINQLGTTMVVVTHEKDLVNQFKKRVVTLEQGVITSDGDGVGYNAR